MKVPGTCGQVLPACLDSNAIGEAESRTFERRLPRSHAPPHFFDSGPRLVVTDNTAAVPSLVIDHLCLELQPYGVRSWDCYGTRISPPNMASSFMVHSRIAPLRGIGFSSNSKVPWSSMRASVSASIPCVPDGSAEASMMLP